MHSVYPLYITWLCFDFRSDLQYPAGQEKMKHSMAEKRRDNKYMLWKYLDKQGNST